MKKLTLFIMAAIAMIFLSCSEDDTTSNKGSLTIHFDNVVSATNLELNTAGRPYTNANGEQFNVTWLTYYISNIKLKSADGSEFTDVVKSDGSAGYYLVNEQDASSQDIVLENIPEGEYKELTFTVGVDAAQVNQGAQTGALDPANGLFWSWNSGYIFLAIEGTSPASTEASNVFQYHIGGYKDDTNGNQVNNIRTVTLSFNGDTAPVRAEHRPEVHLLFDVNKFLNGDGEQVTFTKNASRHSPKPCAALANNIVSSFVVDHVHAN